MFQSPSPSNGIPRPSHALLLLTTCCSLWWPSPVAHRRMPLSSSVALSDSRYSIANCASSGRPSHNDLTHHGCIEELRHPGSQSLAPQQTQVGRMASSCSATGPWNLQASRCCCAQRWCHHCHHSIWAAVKGCRTGCPWSPRGGSPGCWANTGTGAMCCMNWAPSVAGSARACAGGRP